MSSPDNPVSGSAVRSDTGSSPLTTPGASRLLRGLTEAQTEAVLCDSSPLCVLAGPGSGKTTVLTRRVARRLLEGSARAEHVMVVTFTRKAAAGVRGRLERLEVPGAVWAGTFHAAAYRQLRMHWEARGVRPPRLVDDPSGMLREILEDLPGPAHATRSRPAAALVASVAGDIHWARARGISPGEYAKSAHLAGRSTVMTPEQVADVYGRYRDLKRARGLVDLDDLLELSASLLEEDHEAARVQQWRTRHFFVDEFQDLNRAQWRLLEAWLQGRDDLFVVGDANQAIYGWNGADPSFLERLPELLPATTVIRLEDNHRSTPQIVTAARAVLARGDESATAAHEPARATRPDGSAPVVSSFEFEDVEAAAVAAWLRRAHRPGRSWSQLAVLARTHSRLEPVGRALRERGIPYRMASEHPHHESLRGVLGLMRQFPPDRPLRSALADLLEESGSERAGDAWVTEIPAELWQMVEEHALEEPGASVGAFLSWTAAGGADGDLQPSGRDRVELTTFHRAKGLEWPAVAVVGLEDGIVPISYAITEEELDEERRLLYVALTRAEEELWCSWASTRSEAVHGHERSCEPSPYLRPVRDALRGAPDPARHLEGIRELRSMLRAVG